EAYFSPPSCPARQRCCAATNCVRQAVCEESPAAARKKEKKDFWGPCLLFRPPTALARLPLRGQVVGAVAPQTLTGGGSPLHPRFTSCAWGLRTRTPGYGWIGERNGQFFSFWSVANFR
ncbi:MAG: hypothetical protein J2P37_32155, partial [Ktedonobacteraceae bacterium]|nr:hypothetical protein [Ktedonobacteraceae bacterium]